ncbi:MULTISPECIES: restriction endonuclease subunit S [unclassified Nostoc]|uniref:restriction endonuclease subunit S n=1 Tax=unclassified Nostoc TaxID=2593658 RepID=UPI002AD39513|nr:restriction endonuclease subunit S [Nostoc sp. DedQUE03]MDZ7975216.1 restriction endonuclease subunit S [Nostoc sp. DedQUE03]MDZ8048832.1 restriction endonuclease subunit S [Nostoc sp. DedQUE02]
MNNEQHDVKRFLIKASNLTRKKLFVEFYQPKYQFLLDKLHKCPYPLYPLKKLSIRMFDGPFGSNRKVDMYQDSGVPYIRVKDVLPSEISLDKLTYISEEKHNELIRSRVVPGNLLITIAGRLGIAAVFPESLTEGNITGHIVGLELSKKVNPYYVAIFINSQFGEFQAIRLGHRTTRPELNLSEVGEFIIPVPPISVQDCIAQIMQNAYHTHQEKLLAAQNLIVGIQEYVIKVIGIKNVLPRSQNRFLIRRSQLNRFDVRYFLPFYTQLEQIIENSIYPKKTLSEICINIVNGLTPAKDGYTENGCVVIKVSSLTKNWKIEWKKVAFISKTFFKKAKKAYVKDGDLLLLSASHQLDYIGGSFGLVRNIPIEYLDKCMAVGELIIVRVNHQIVLPEYLLTCFIIKPIQELINRMSRGQTAHLYAEDLQHLRVPLPPMKIQQVIVDELNRRRNEANRLYTEAEYLLTEAKARVERMILGEEEVR